LVVPLHRIPVLIVITIISAFLLVAELPMFALKFKNLHFKGNEIRFSFLLLALICLLVFHFTGIVFIFILYILLSLINNIFINKKTNEIQS